MLFLPNAVCDEDEKGCVEWGQIEFFGIASPSGIHPSGTIGVRSRQFIPAESVFPCIGVYERRGSQCARFSPASVSPVGSAFVINGHPGTDPHTVSLAASVGGVTGVQHSLSVGCSGWSFFPYCREPPPSLTLSTAGICTRAPEGWRALPLYADFVSTFDSVASKYMSKKEKSLCDVATLPLSVIVIKRDVEPGEELLIAFNQFDGIGRLPAYTSPCPFLRMGTAVPLLHVTASMQVVRRILAEQASQAITDSYVKLLEDTAGTDARTTERISVAILNLTKAAQQHVASDGCRVALALVVPTSAAAVNGIMAPSCKQGSVGGAALKRARLSPSVFPASAASVPAKNFTAPVPVFAASFRVPQSFVPPP